MKKSVCSLVCAAFGLLTLFAPTGLANSTITWSTAIGVQLTGHLGGPLTSGPSDAIGYLVQLIYDAGNDGPDPVNLSDPYGVSGNDIYLSYSYCGHLTTTQGAFSAQYNNTNANGSAYYIRAWEGVSSLSGSGLIPTPGGSLYYGNSTSYYVNASGGAAPGFEDFTLQNGFMTDMNAVPEPATLALAFTAIGFFVIKRLRRKKDD